MELTGALGITIVIVIASVMASVGYLAGGNKPDVTRTISETTTATNTQFVPTLTTTTQTITTTSVSTATLTDIMTTTTTSLTTTTAIRTLGTGITITDYKLFMTNVAKDSVLKLNLTVNFAAVNYPTYVTEQAITILTPTNGNAADIKFAPNPIITQSSGLTLTLTMFTVITHQVVAGTYMIEYAISTSQGSALVFTVLEIT